MASSSQHGRLLALAGRAHLIPIGCRQKGRSRFWFDDHGWWAAIVEFQPSSFSKGSYLNVGAMWLWHPAEHWVFNEFERLSPFQEFRDDCQFQDIASELAALAAAQVLALRGRFDSIGSVARHLTQEPAKGLWPNYHAAIATLLMGDSSAAKAHFEAVAAVLAAAPSERFSDLQFRVNRLSLSLTSLAQARQEIAAEVARTRGKLGLPQLTDIADSWA